MYSQTYGQCIEEVMEMDQESTKTEVSPIFLSRNRSASWLGYGGTTQAETRRDGSDQSSAVCWFLKSVENWTHQFLGKVGSTIHQFIKQYQFIHQHERSWNPWDYECWLMINCRQSTLIINPIRLFPTVHIFLLPIKAPVKLYNRAFCNLDM